MAILGLHPSAVKLITVKHFLLEIPTWNFGFGLGKGVHSPKIPENTILSVRDSMVK